MSPASAKHTLLILLIISFAGQHALRAQSTLSWSSIAPGVWSAKVGKPDPFNFYSVSGVPPKTEALQGMQSAAFPLPENEIRASVADGKVYLPLSVG